MSLFSEKLSYYIKKTRLTLLFLSSVSDLDVSYISKIKKGERLPRNKDLLVLLRKKIFGMPIKFPSLEKNVFCSIRL